MVESQELFKWWKENGSTWRQTTSYCCHIPFVIVV